MEWAEVRELQVFFVNYLHPGPIFLARSELRG